MKRIILILTISSFVCGAYQLQAMQKSTAFIITKNNNISDRRMPIANNIRTISGNATDVRKGIEVDNRFRVPQEVQEAPDQQEIDILTEEVDIELARAIKFPNEQKSAISLMLQEKDQNLIITDSLVPDLMMESTQDMNQPIYLD